jgi:transposase
MTSEDTTKELAHMGLIAAAMKKTGIIDSIDQLIPVSKEKGAQLTMGQRTAGLIFNSLGFIDTRLYMTSSHMKSLAIERLFDESVKSHMFTDDSLGRLLDRIAEYGSTAFFVKVAMKIIDTFKPSIKRKIIHFDTTSLSLYGQYEGTKEDDFRPDYGYAKNGRHDLKQVLLLLGVFAIDDIGLPIMMQPLSGNFSDKKTLGNAPILFQEIFKSIKEQDDFLCVVDSAGYELSLKNSSFFRWLSRVPETHARAKSLINADIPEDKWVDLGKGYKQVVEHVFYQNVAQRWVLVFSEQAREREEHSLIKKIAKEEALAKRELKQLNKNIFECEKDASLALKKVGKKWKYHQLDAQISPVMKHRSAGKPKDGAEKILIGYEILGNIRSDEERIKEAKRTLGRFILGTNDLDVNRLPDNEILSSYKKQSSVESGFAFIKNNTFEVDSVFLKKPSRIEALMAVMTLSLMMYGICQLQVRSELDKKNETILNAANKPTKKPTAKYVFRLFRMVHVQKVKINDLWKDRILNLDATLVKIIDLFGPDGRKIYGLT